MRPRAQPHSDGHPVQAAGLRGSTATESPAPHLQHHGWLERESARLMLRVPTPQMSHCTLPESRAPCQLTFEHGFAEVRTLCGSATAPLHFVRRVWKLSTEEGLAQAALAELAEVVCSLAQHPPEQPHVALRKPGRTSGRT
mmetsp:Transcript_12043/g.27004  ORF Transcript_12043/g.27004 Transcript_12043/m.27004 type:complete len:141 (-) Transcript_12043:1178-1600(-)